MVISSKLSRLLVAGAITATATGIGVTSASANTGGCNALPSASSVIDSNSYSQPAVGVNIGVGTANGDFLGAYGSNYGDFDLVYNKAAGSAISVYFEYFHIYSGGGCATYTSGTYTIDAGQKQFYKFSGLPAWGDGAVIAMHVANEGWVEILVS